MKKTLLLIAGWLTLVVGIIGLVVPIMPTTPFVVLAAVCFSYSSPRFYEWLRKLPYFGPYIENYKTKKGVPLKDKLRVLFFLWAGISVSALLLGRPWATILLSIIGLAVTAHILWLKTHRPETEAPENPSAQKQITYNEKSPPNKDHSDI